MSATKSTPWIVGTALVSFAILAISWFLAISPVLATAADSRAQSQQQQDQNAVLAQKNTKLAEQFTHLDEYKATIATIRVQIPLQAEETAINRELAGIAVTSGVTLTDVNVTVPQPFVPVAGKVAAAPAAVPGAATPAGATGTAANPASAGSGAPAGFYAIPMSITLVGTYDQATAFLASFQTGTQRLFLATSINAVTQQAAGASAGRPALAAGDLEMTVAGYAYVLLGSGDATAQKPAATAVAPVLPVPSGQRNFFQPLF
jgi:Tfp pilus assembly protein PilO